MAEEWMKENTLAVEKGLRAEIVEDFINGLKGLFEEHYIDIPEEKVNVVEELTTRVEELEDSLNEQINASIQLKKELNEKIKTEAIHAVCEGLTQTQVEKMKQLAESVEFTSEEEFADKVVTIRESYFEQSVKSANSSALNEEITVEEEEKKFVSSDPAIAQYAQSISKSLVK
jgi:LPS O-antigen subunit length determinant protein (WzzB/FepE family)